MVINLEQKKIHFDLRFILTYNIITCSRRQAWENFSQSQRLKMQNQSNREITFDTQMKTAQALSTKALLRIHSLRVM